MADTTKSLEIIDSAKIVDLINQIEDEIHFLFHCSKYSLIRYTFYN